MTRRALRKDDYIEEEFYNVAKDKLSQYDMDDDGRYLPSTLILTGASGVGKSEAALQLVKDLKRTNRQAKFIEWQFCCDSKQALLNDMTSFNVQHDLQMASLERHDNVDSVFKNLFEVLNRRFPDHIKCLIFDDAERSTEIVRRINDYICEEVEADNYMNWKMIVTTQDDDESSWLLNCDCIKENNFTKIREFQIGETQRFMARVPDLQEEHIAQLHNKLDGLPVALKVAREYLLSNKLYNMVKYLEEFFRDLNRLDHRNAVNACFCLCIERLVESLEHHDLACSMIKMISLLDEKNITANILTALAEAVIVDANGHVNPRTQATVLSNKLLEGLKNRFLCDVMESPTGHKVVSLHQLVRKSASVFRQKDGPEGQRFVVRMCLTALTKIIPKDGRMHLSHIIYSYMYRHAFRLRDSIRSLIDKDIVSRQSSAEILLLYSSMLSSMAYCLLAQRIPQGEATRLLEDALDVYSVIFTGRSYDEVGTQAHGNPDDVRKADFLLKEGRGEAGKLLMENRDYAKIVSNLSPYLRLTKKDLKNMIDFEEVHDEKDYLQDGHINQYYLKELTDRNMIVEAPMQMGIYNIEILIEIYYVWVRIHSFSDGATLNRANKCGQAALLLCEHVRNTYNKPLMTEVLIRRSVLEIELKMGDQDVNRILEDYTALADVGNDDSRRYGYEYGVRRTDFYQDDYHRLLCKEGRAACFGKLCEQSRQQNEHQRAENYFMQGDEIFQTLTAENQQNPNFQTLSKSYKRYSAFLAQCDKLDETVRILLDAMYFLHKHLKQRAPDGTEHPEQNNCGKFTDLYVKLEKFYGAWQRINSNRNTMLLKDGTDVRRNDYLYSFNNYYQKNHPQPQADAPGKYPIMIDLLPPNYKDNDDEEYHPPGAEGGDFRPVPPQDY